MQFWPETATDASWQKLQEINRQFSFTLIDGWAVYLWTHQHKSKDIDVVVTSDTLYQLKHRENLQKNDRLKKYEIKFDWFDVDVYVQHYSKLALPIDTIFQHAQNVEGFAVASPETLLILKQGAWRDRKHAIKGRKDEIDLLSLLIHAPINWKTYRKLLEQNQKQSWAHDLKHIIQTFPPDDLKYVGQNPHSFKKWRMRILQELKKNRREHENKKQIPKNQAPKKLKNKRSINKYRQR